jgi:hypothetical protein
MWSGLATACNVRPTWPGWACTPREEGILLFALGAEPSALVLAEDIHAGLGLAAAAVFLGVGVVPDFLPEVQAEGFEEVRVVGRGQLF